MGNSSSIPNCEAAVRTRDGKKFAISYHSLVEYILLLRKVIHNPEMTTEGPVLDYFIKDYCKRMVQRGMRTKKQQLKLPWQIEWIWHVHRLHPLAYLNDSQQNQLVVPTFEIDLIWHTHMRFPSHYHQLSIALCGFLVDHDASIESNGLTDGYQKTADRWKETYNSEYGQDIDHTRLRASQIISSNAVVFVPITSGGIERDGYRGGGAGGGADDGYADGRGCGGCEFD